MIRNVLYDKICKIVLFAFIEVDKENSSNNKKIQMGSNLDSVFSALNIPTNWYYRQANKTIRTEKNDIKDTKK